MLNSYGHLYSIGYWANTKRWTQTHIRNCETDMPVCGAQVAKNKSFQWCCWGYTEYDYIECDHCKNWKKNKLIEESKKLIKLENLRPFMERRRRRRRREDRR